MDKNLPALVNLLVNLFNYLPENIDQKWIYFNLLKGYLEWSLIITESKIINCIPFGDRDVFAEFAKLKNLLWLTVGAVHGRLLLLTKEVGSIALYDVYCKTVN